MKSLKIKNGTNKGYIEALPGDGINLAYRTSTTQRGRVQKQSCQTLDTSGGELKGVLMNDLRIRKLTPRECGRLMGVNENDISKMEKVNSNAQLYKQFGNSIVVDVMYYIFKEMM